MSPEQLEGKTSDARTDIFALGTVLRVKIVEIRNLNEKTRLLSAIQNQREMYLACRASFDAEVALFYIYIYEQLNPSLTREFASGTWMSNYETVVAQRTATT